MRIARPLKSFPESLAPRAVYEALVSRESNGRNPVFAFLCQDEFESFDFCFVALLTLHPILTDAAELFKLLLPQVLELSELLLCLLQSLREVAEAFKKGPNVRVVPREDVSKLCVQDQPLPGLLSLLEVG